MHPSFLSLRLKYYTVNRDRRGTQRRGNMKLYTPLLIFTNNVSIFNSYINIYFHLNNLVQNNPHSLPYLQITQIVTPRLLTNI